MAGPKLEKNQNFYVVGVCQTQEIAEVKKHFFLKNQKLRNTAYFTTNPQSSSDTHGLNFIYMALSSNMQVDKRGPCRRPRKDSLFIVMNQERTR